jgi:hypothetical protein
MNMPTAADGTPASDTLSLPELERAINFWRRKHPSTGEEMRLCAEADALAEPYALAIVMRRASVQRDELSAAARAAIDAWRAAEAS